MSYERVQAVEEGADPTGEGPERPISRYFVDEETAAARHRSLPMIVASRRCLPKKKSLSPASPHEPLMPHRFSRGLKNWRRLNGLNCRPSRKLSVLSFLNHPAVVMMTGDQLITPDFPLTQIKIVVTGITGDLSITDLDNS